MTEFEIGMTLEEVLETARLRGETATILTAHGDEVKTETHELKFLFGFSMGLVSIEPTAIV